MSGDDVRRVINAGIVQMEAVKELYFRAVKLTTVNRAVLPLYEEAGLTRGRRVRAGKDQERAGDCPSEIPAPIKSA